MQKIQTKIIRLPVESTFDEPTLSESLRRELKIPSSSDFFFKITKRSIDARSRNIMANLELSYADQAFTLNPHNRFDHEAKKYQKAALIVGSGPAGLFAALRCIELGIKPIVIERGADVRARRRDLAAINKDQIVNPESNYCFGEGGAGTYSDGKLYTRSKKRGDISRVLEILVKYGATSEILVDAHPHIGTNKLPGVVTALREAILAAGGEIRFNTKMTDIIIDQTKICGIVVNQKEEVLADALILATGHSARDVFELLHKKEVYMEAKSFAIGVRIEHSQGFVDQCQYHKTERGLLPPASYALVSQTQSGGLQRGVFSFCMCPGGFIVPSSTSQEELVVNGMSPSRRDSRFANSGVVVAVEPPDWKHHATHGALAALRFQQEQEQSAYALVKKALNVDLTQVMPAQQITDFMKNKPSKTLNDTSYQPGVLSFDFREIFPNFISDSLFQGLQDFNKKMRGYDAGQMIGLESRTSSPVRIPRDKESLMHSQIIGLFPCGEGAGYAGGIVSAAMDGERCAEAVSKFYGL